jgi:hypothetical protein
LLLVQKCIVVISVVYVLDAGAYPLVHVPLPLLTALYFGSAAEIWGISRIVSYLRSRLR